MNLRERALYHQVHPLKLVIDIGSAVVALLLFAQHRFALAVVVLLVPPAIASAYLVAVARLDYMSRTHAGQRMHRMTSTATLLRLIGMTAMCIGAWRRDWALILAGAAAIGWVWLRVLW